MRTSSPLLPAALLLVALAGGARAGLPGPDATGCFPNEHPCPGRCGLEVVGQGTPCQFLFRADGGFDTLVVLVTLRDAFDNPVADCLTTVTLGPNAETLALCSCCPLQQSIPSGIDGTVTATWNALGGRGSLDVMVTALCGSRQPIGARTVEFTSTDLDGSCEPAGSTGVIDLGVFAGGLPPSPYRQSSDFDCDGTVDIVDLGLWAGGLTFGCDDAICP